MLALAVAILAACLPDLGPLLPASEPPPEPALRFCGDGIIESREDGSDAGESCDPGDAQAPGCSDCRVTCSGTLDDAGAHCYFALSPTRSFADAVRQCTLAGAHLVTFSSDREARHVDSIAAAHWVGLSVSNVLEAYEPTVDPPEPGFPLPSSATSCTGCFGRGADGGAFPIAPDVDAGVATDCIASEGGQWFRVPCNGTRELATICEREPVGTRAEFCNGPYCTNVVATAGKKTYLVTLSNASSEDARASCEAQGGRLVVLSTREEREQLVREIRVLLPPPSSIWIGLSRSASSPGFTWDDGQPEATYPSPWGADQPPAGATGRAYLVLDDNAFDTQLAYVETSPEAQRPFVCERDVVP